MHVAGLVRNHRLARAIADAGWSECLRQLHYKGPIFGCVVSAAGRFEPSTKRCHRCGLVKDTLPLSERTFRCQGCGLVCDRDDNASRNLIPQALGKFTPADSHEAGGSRN